MRIFKNVWFSRFAEREGISDAELKAVANRLETGQVDADLGGGVKQRLARPGAGKSGGLPGYPVLSQRRADLLRVWLCKIHDKPRHCGPSPLWLLPGLMHPQFRHRHRRPPQ
ncbi:MAG: type II toxin-antitoxin system RelE/ParE family toxin [Treponema sp.]|nr:type II toxin-antitoxin system RelE/ParE family toxin [Treponema sp.]